MLTLEQKSKLKPLTNNERYGNLLLNAMKTWETTNPTRGTFGITDYKVNDDVSLESEKLDYYILDNGCKCCLIGASLLGKKSCSGFTSALEEEYGLSFAEKIAIIDGFDAPNIYSVYSDHDAFLFAETVSEIIFGVSK
jgi:hypothetical protein